MQLIAMYMYAKYVAHVKYVNVHVLYMCIEYITRYEIFTCMCAYVTVFHS